MMKLLSTPVGRFRAAAIAEAISWAGLLVGMVFKYLVVQDPIGVQIMGPIHGALFIAYVIATIEAVPHLGGGRRTLAIGLLAAIPPFTTLWFERWVLRAR